MSDAPQCSHEYDTRDSLGLECRIPAVTTYHGSPVCLEHYRERLGAERAALALEIVGDLPIEQLRALVAAGGLAAIARSWRWMTGLAKGAPDGR